MDDLTTRVTAATGLDQDTARRAIGTIMAFLRKEGPAREVDQLVAAIPDGEGLIAQAGRGGLLGMFGGVLGLGQKLMSVGVGMGQMQPLARELFAYGRETAGEDVIGSIVNAVPGLRQFA